MFILNLFTILPLSCALFVLLFGIFVFAQNSKSPLHRLMFGFSVSMFFWMLGTFMMFGIGDRNPEWAIFWDRFVYAGVVFMPSLMHHFSLIFTNNNRQRVLLTLNYVMSFIFLIASRTVLFVDGLYVYSWGVHSKAQLLHHIFLGYFFLGTGLFFYNLFKFYIRNSEREKKLQTIYTFLAFAIVIFIGGSAYLYGYGIDTKFPFAYFSGIVFPVILFYAVTRHHLLGGRLVGVEVLAGLANFVSVTEIFLAKTITELLLRLIFALMIVIISIFLILSVRKEIARRQEVTELAHSLEKANVRLQELDRQKTEFLSIASHQLRTPLSIIKGYIELIQDGAYGKITKKTNNVLGEMDESNERLVKLVDEFLNITRIEQGRTKFVFAVSSLNELITSTVKELKDRAASKGLKIVWKENTEIDSIYMDEEKIRQVIFNYIDNAIKYSEKGTITITTEREENGITIRVKDHGIGFEEVDHANLFQKFYRGQNVQNTNVNGTGLGIYVCRKFIEAHDGHVWAHSKGLGKGSEFGLWIPGTERVGGRG